MLVAMTFSAGLIVVTVTSLSLGQFVIEYAESIDPESSRRFRDPENIKEPLLSASPTSYEPSVALHSYPHYRSSTSESYVYSHRSANSSVTSTVSFFRTPSPVREVKEVKSQPVATKPRTRSKSKPSRIFIHPADSNLARADAVAQQLGLAGDTDLVKGSQHPLDGEASWMVGKGKDLARDIMGPSRRSTLS
ncbi:hypothetical protein NM688_g8097 [Phlebia brevispora]|uniref:Uncharacterized protein n=1 Tax=Phlebia brevispora TaxID=194682 RepID=A0ACC1RXU9_9APHY|nr:hypothetical protein NM688_g8097 [Phlebia brevispora]